MADYTFSVNERTGGCQYRVRLLDAVGAAIAPARVTSLELTLKDVKTGTYLNDRHHQDVLNANNVTLGVDGWMAWTMVPEDNVVVETARQTGDEVHEATFTVKADAGVVELSWTIEVRVRALGEV